MLWDLLSVRWFQAGLAFFVLCVGGSLLYSWHVQRNTAAEVAETPRKVQPLENKNETRIAEDTVDTSKVDFEHAETSITSDDTQMSDDAGAAPNDAAPVDFSDAFLPDDFVSEEEIAEDVPVSPFGFGPYPEIPADFPFKVSWTKFGKEGELASRVMVKAWNQGEKFVSASTSKNGKVYLIYPNTVYVKYGQRLLPDGTVSKYIKRAYGPDDLPIPAPGEDFPEHVHVLDFDTDGIDPYEYLSLPK